MKVHDARDGFNDLKPEFLSAAGFPWFWLAAALLVILLIVKFRPKNSKEIARVNKKLDEYLSELRSLQLKVNSGVETPKTLTAEASLILRRYIYEQAQISILESTPQEAELQLTKHNKFSGNLASEITKLLSQLENISFSEQKSDLSSIQTKAIQLIDQCQSLLKKIHPRLAEVVI